MSDFIKNVKLFTKKNSPAILTTFGIVGMFTAGVMAVSATPKALKLLEEKKEELETEKLPVVDVVKTTWLCYIPAVGVSIVSTICLIEAHSINTRRNMAIATACQISEKAFKEYRSKVVEAIGEKKEGEIKNEIAKDAIRKKSVVQQEVVVLREGNTLCYDAVSGRYFKSDIETIKKAVNELNRRMLRENYVCLNEFYGEIGLPYTNLGDDIGWSIDRDGLIELDLSSQLAEDGTPCLVISYRVTPRFGYDIFG